MISLLTKSQIRSHEFEYIKQTNSLLVLMEKAGGGLADILMHYKEPFLFICGKGNNGGDGFVAARYLIERNKKVFVVMLSNPEELSNDAKNNFFKIQNNITPYILKNVCDRYFLSLLRDSNTVVDCILGTGVSNSLGSFLNELISVINDAKKDVVACDIPTGILSDSGVVNDPCIYATETVTFGSYKIGMMLYPAKNFVGKITLVDIGLPKYNSNNFLLDVDFVKSQFPVRLNVSHKGSFGKTTIISGSVKFPGAAILTAKAASIIGSGLTVLCTSQDVFNMVTPAIPEAIHCELNLDAILKELNTSTSCIIGPGLTTNKSIIEIVMPLIEKINIPLVLDADGINMFEGYKDLLKNLKSKLILTPHPKEMARLLNLSVQEVLENKLSITQELAKELNAIVLLKGPASIISDGSMNYVSPFANSALAKGGTGDVLSGFIGGLISQGTKPDLATCIGVFMHGIIGEYISKEKTEYALLPEDLINYLPKVIKEIMN